MDFQRQRADGYVYLVQADDDLYKIGRTLNPAQRASYLKKQYPDIPGDKVMIHSFLTLYADAWEKFFHSFYSAYRYPYRYKEWFYLNQEDVDLIKCFCSVINFLPHDSRFTKFVSYDEFEWFYTMRFNMFSKIERNRFHFLDNQKFKIHLGGWVFKEPYRQYMPFDVGVRQVYPVGRINSDEE